MWLYLLPPERKQCSEYPLNHKDKREAEHVRAVRSYKISTYDTQGDSHQPPSANWIFVSALSPVCHRIHLKSLRNHAFQIFVLGTSLAVQWLRLHLSVQGGVGLIPGQQLRFHMPCGVAKKKEKSNRITGTDHWCCTQSQAELWTSTHTTRLGVSLPPENSAQRFSGAMIYIRM